MTTDTTTTTTSTPTATPTREEAERAVHALLGAASDPRENLVTRLQVSQYVGWRARFDEMQQLPGSADVANPKVFYDIDNETILAVLADVSNLPNAKAWAQGGWRAALPVAGLEAAPAIYFGTHPDEVSSGAKLGAHFTVNDYPRWHQLFKEMEGSRVRSRITDPQVFRSSEDGSEVLVLWDIASTELVCSWIIEDIMTGYPAATGAANNTARFFVELGSGAGQEAHHGN